MEPPENTNAVSLTGIQLLLQASAAEGMDAETWSSTAPISPTVQSSTRYEPSLSPACPPDTAHNLAAVSTSLALSRLQETPPALSSYSPQFRAASSLILNRMRDGYDPSNTTKTTPGAATVVPVSDGTVKATVKTSTAALETKGTGKALPPPPPSTSLSPSQLTQPVPTSSARLALGLKRKRSQSNIVSSGSGSSIVSNSNTDPHKSPRLRRSAGEDSTKVEKSDHVGSSLGTTASSSHGNNNATSVVSVSCHECAKKASHLLNRLVICTKCSKAWHQQCHHPEIRDGLLAAENAPGRRQWLCISCETVAGNTHHALDKTSNIVPILPLASTSTSQPRRVCIVHDQGVDKSPSDDGSFTLTDRVSWQDRSAEERQKYLSNLPQADLVRLLTLSVQLHPDLPIFPQASPRKTNVATEKGSVRRLPSGGNAAFSSVLGIRNGIRSSGLAAPSQANAGLPNKSNKSNQPVEFEGQKGTHVSGKKKQIMNSVRNNSNAASSRKAAIKETDAAAAADTDDEDPTGLMEAWPRPGHGLYTQLRPDKDDDAMIERNDYDAFSHVIYDGTGRKIMENSVSLLCR